MLRVFSGASTGILAILSPLLKHWLCDESGLLQIGTDDIRHHHRRHPFFIAIFCLFILCIHLNQ